MSIFLEIRNFSIARLTKYRAMGKMRWWVSGRNSRSKMLEVGDKRRSIKICFGCLPATRTTETRFVEGRAFITAECPNCARGEWLNCLVPPQGFLCQARHARDGPVTCAQTGLGASQTAELVTGERWEGARRRRMANWSRSLSISSSKASKVVRRKRRHRV